MKVAVVRPTSALRNTAFEGQVRCYDYLASEYDIDVDVFCRSDSRLSTNVTAANYVEVSQTVGERIHHLYREGVTKILRFNDHVNTPEFSEVRKLLRDRDYDVVEVSDPRLYETAYDAYREAEIGDTPLVIVAEASKPLSNPLPDDYAVEVTDYATGILLSSPRAHESFTEAGLLPESDERVRYTGHPIDTDLFSPSESLEGSENASFLSVGFLEERKGYKDICRAFDEVSGELTFEWNVVGDGELAEWIRDYATRNGFIDNVTVHGRVDHDDIHRYYDDNDVFILHSKETDTWEEYFGVVYAEAMSCGLPVVGSQSGAVPWVVRDGKDGILPPEGDVDALSSAILELARDPEKRRTMGRNGRENVRNRFSMEAVAETFLEGWRSASRSG